MNRKTAARFWLGVILLSQLMGVPAFAQLAPPENTPQSETSLLAEDASSTAPGQEPAASAPPEASQSQQPAVPIPQGEGLLTHEQAFSAEHSLAGLFAQCTEYFNAGYWDIQYAAFTLEYSATQLADSALSSLTVSLNGEPFYSARIVPSLEHRNQRLEVLLPLEKIHEGQNSITVSTYVRTKDGKPCVDDVAGANWMVVKANSAVALLYYPQASSRTVADYYKQLTSIDALENRQTMFFLPEQPSDSELTAVAVMLSGISSQASLSYENIGLDTGGQETDLARSKYSVYIASYDRLFPSIRERLTEEQTKAAQQGALLAVLEGSSGEPGVLLVTAQKEEALQTAALRFANSALMEQTQAAWRRVMEQERVIVEPAPVAEYLPLTESGSNVQGPFRQNASFYIEYPANRRLAYSSQISLAFRYSENLDFDRSLATVYVNDKPVGSKKLTMDKAGGDTALFDIPTDLEVSGSFTVRVSFDLEIKDLWCNLNQAETPWAWVSPESMLKISSVEANGLLFENYPSPFLRDNSLDNLVVVVPDQPGKADLEAMRGILLTLGRSQKDNAGSLRVARMSQPGDLSHANVISIGRLEVNELLKQQHDKLFFKFSPEGTTILSNEKILLDPGYGASLGTLQLLDSPYSQEKRAFLVVSGVTDATMLKAARYLGLSDNLWQLYGDGVVIDDTQAMSYRFKADNKKSQPLLEQVAGRRDIQLLALAGVLVLGLGVFALILLGIKYRRRKNRERK
ncbi:cellulose biosynthesis cyclic di-GMP-binding regulatory protein BcsB [Oscillospiraceae bacterium MB08-C2-2]|nr:cellulose biosynthesis cyclic di-GMP-binding regulatory protein BcsB [Oscillospiraceae bacterium MB08-C2-2]